MNMDLTQYIDLDSYSSSPGFLGYTDNIPDFSEAGIDALCDDFLKKMAEYINDVTVVSSLFISSNKEELSTDYDISLEKIDKFYFLQNEGRGKSFCRCYGVYSRTAMAISALSVVSPENSVKS